MAAYILTNIPARLTNASGSPAQYMYTYITGTTTNKTAYTDQAGLVAHANPIVADASGTFPQVWLANDAEYRIKVVCVDTTTLFTWDDISGSGGNALQQLASTTDAANGDALIGVKRTVAGAVATTLHAWIEGQIINVRTDCGAVGDGVADDTAAINLGISILVALGGGTLHFPQGTYKTTSEILITSSSIRFTGTGKRMVYPGVFVASANTPSTIMPVHAGRNAFRFNHASATGRGAFAALDLNFATLEAGSVPTAAFGWDCSGVFLRDFTFERVGIHGFTSAFDVYKPGGANTQMGLLKVRNCNINRNQWIARTLNGTQWNGFLFHDNEAGQNGFSAGQGGISVSAHAASVCDNCLEGMRDPVLITGSYRGVKVKGNYFEQNVGRACVELNNIRGPIDVGPNTYLAIVDADIAHKVLLSGACGLGSCVDPYWPGGTHKIALPLLGADATAGDNVLNSTLDPLTYPYVRCDRLEGFNYAREPQHSAIATQRVTVNQREINPQSGLPMPVQEYTTAGAGAVALAYAINGSNGQYVVVSWLLKQQPGSATANPYISLSVNGTAAAGSKDYPIDGFTTYWRAGEWVLITCVIKLGVAMTSLGVTLFPHGTAPAAGLVSRFLRPVVYTIDDINKVIPYVDNYTAQSVTASPTVGTWKQGDVLFNGAVAAAGQAEFACSAGGTPGTWVYG